MPARKGKANITVFRPSPGLGKTLEKSHDDVAEGAEGLTETGPLGYGL